ncbi:MAG: helix-turn-helix domain-containing protein [Oscillospiraceae bacterium]
MNYDYSKAIEKNISNIRQSRGLTQEQLSAKLQVVGCDITRSALAKIEVGQRHLYPDELKALKTVLEVCYEELFV